MPSASSSSRGSLALEISTYFPAARYWTARRWR